MIKSVKTLLICTCLLAVSSTYGRPRDLGVFSNVRTTTARMPFYKGDKLEYFLRGRSTAMRGKLLDVVWPMVDIIRSGVSVEEIATSDSGVEVYPLDAPLDKVLSYWEERSYSEGVGVSEAATFDQANRTAAGTAKVFLRSPMLDINASGFTADLARKWVKFTSDVEIVIRSKGHGSSLMGGDDPKSKSDKENISIIRAYCNEMTVDDARKMITLHGNVRVFDEAGTITSQQLELEYGDKGSAKDKKSSDLASRSRSNKLRVARFIGKVHAVRKLDADEAADGEQYADADRMVYTADKDTLELTGSRPRMVRGKDYGEADRIVILTKSKVVRFYEKCLFISHPKDKPNAQPDRVTANYADWDQNKNLVRLMGNVHIHSPGDRTDLRAARMAVTLADSKGTGAAKTEKKGSLSTSGQKIKHAVAAGNVRIDRTVDGGVESARGGRMTFIGGEEKLIMEQKPEVKRNDDILRGGMMTYFMKQERMIVTKGSHITLSSKTASSNSPDGKKSASGGPVTVDSDASDLHYGANMLKFAGNVKVRGRGMLLDSAKLDITLEDAPVSAGTKNKAEQSKKPLRALATGSVHAEDDGGILDCGMLDIRFGEKAVPGKREIEKVFMSEKVRLQNRAAKKAAPEANFVGPTLLGNSRSGITTLDADHGTMDLLKHQADFYEHVTVYDDKVMLECEHLRLIAKPTSDKIESTASFKARDEFPDRLAVGDNRELERVLAHEKVVMSRTLPNGEVQKARGDHGRYEVKERKVYLTCDPPKRPQAVTPQGGMIGDSVVVELDSQQVFVENGDALGRRDK